MTPPAKKIIELSLREALQLGHSDIRPEHILLALLREDKEGILEQALDTEFRRDIRGRVIAALLAEKKSAVDSHGNVLPICCGQPMGFQEAFGKVRRYECRRRLHHPAVWVDLSTARHLTDEELPRQVS